MFLSLVLRNLETLANEPLQSTEAGYDMRRLTNSIQNMSQIVEGLKSWEEKQ
ncbi:hypothetical protein FRUB_01346 [Fimbriiglobus ruber]|uniref:Uncharacterized protein n=1 Tax=Fimbriiglobus ruber TaxID=1908690 RepID=A0A225E8S5_9BACT|nr:hypothetical protein FRUB_01346 [Fimbriiglobus ruber]